MTTALSTPLILPLLALPPLSADVASGSRRALSAALLDLTDLDVGDAAALPGDGKVAGFDTGAEALQDSPIPSTACWK